MDSKFRQLMKNEDLQGMKACVEKMDSREMCEMVTERICFSDSPKILNALLVSLAESPSSDLKRRKLVETTLVVLRKAKVSNSHANKIVSRIYLDFPQYPTLHLVKLIEFCQSSIQKNDDDFMSWKDLIPQLIEALSERTQIDHNGSPITGTEYKAHLVKSICNFPWDPAILTSLATMFGEMALTKDEHQIVVRALCNKLPEIEPNEIPPLVHQLLTLCRHQNGGLLIVALQKYFTERYSAALNNDNEEFSENIGEVSLRELQEVESTILYHIWTAANLSHISIKNFVRSLRNMTNTPEYVLDPFIMTVLLTVSSIYEDQVFETLKIAISRQIHDEERRKKSAWLREVLPDECDVMSLIEQVINNSMKDRQLVLKGLVDLAFVLMGIGAKLGDGMQTASLWEIGIKILQKLVRKRNEIGNTVVQQLIDRIVTSGTTVSQYTDCLSYMCRKKALVMLDCQAWIITLLEQLSVIPRAAAVQVIQAVLPLARISNTLRDTLVLILRKALYRKETQTQQMAVAGFLLLLKSLKINALGALSQTGSSSSSTITTTGSVLTQVNLEVHQKEATINPKYATTLCYEVLSILKRCFIQQVDVRLHLYEGLYDALLENPELSSYVVEMLLTHFNKFYEPDENILPPLKLEKCTVVRGAESVLQEPIGDLIFVMQRVYIKAASGDSIQLNKLAIILESLCKRMPKSELEHFELDDITDLADNVPESQQKLHNLKQMLRVYEALIAYRLAAWTKETAHAAQNIHSLFEGYNRLVERSKQVYKPKKGEAKKKKDKDATDAPNKKSSRPSTVKLPPTIMDLDTVYRALLLLYSDSVPWTSKDQASALRVRNHFHRYILQTCLQLIQNARQLKHHEMKRHKEQFISKYLEIGCILYQKVVMTMDELRNFDQQVAVLGLDCMRELCELMCSTAFSSELPKFLKSTGNVDITAELDLQLMGLIPSLMVLLTTTLEEREEEEAVAKKFPSLLLATIAPLVLKLPPDSKNTSKIFQDLLEIMQFEDVETSVVVAIIQLIMNIEEHSEMYGITLNKISLQLCHILGTIDKTKITLDESFKILNINSALQVYTIICTMLKHKLDNTMWLLGRLRAEQMLTTIPGMDVETRNTELKVKERRLCSQLSHIVQSLQILGNAEMIPGPNTDAILRNLQHLYNTLSALTKYFYAKSTVQNPAFQAVKFIQVVQLAGESLAACLYQLITHIESLQNRNKSKSADASVQRSKILKETKIIPKVIFEIEQFKKHLMVLGKKTNIPLEKYAKHSVTRDFRIKNPQLIEGLEGLDVSMLTTQSTTHNVSQSEEMERSDSSIRDSDEQNETPPAKKPRLKKSS